MGMGEPFDNTEEVMKSLDILTSEYGYGLSPTRITVSTVGVLPGMNKYLREGKSHLALSLHSPFEEERARLMPVENKFPLDGILAVLRDYPCKGQRRLMIEYILFNGVNDTPRHARALVKKLAGVRCKVNLIPFNEAPILGFAAAPRAKAEAFQRILKKGGIMTTIRKSKGQDISAACGLLSTSNEHA